MSDLIETMRDAINERVAGTAMIQACYLEAACEEIERLEHELAECKAYADNYKQEWQETLQEVLESRAALAAKVLQMRQCVLASTEYRQGNPAFEAALDTKPAESFINAVKAQALREAAKTFDTRVEKELWEMSCELDPRCRKCGGNMIHGKAIQQMLTGVPDFPGDTRAMTLHPSGGTLIDCMKCEKCGWSVTE